MASQYKSHGFSQNHMILHEVREKNMKMKTEMTIEKDSWMSLRFLKFIITSKCAACLFTCAIHVICVALFVYYTFNSYTFNRYITCVELHV